MLSLFLQSKYLYTPKSHLKRPQIKLTAHSCSLRPYLHLRRPYKLCLKTVRDADLRKESSSNKTSGWLLHAAMINGVFPDTTSGSCKSGRVDLFLPTASKNPTSPHADARHTVIGGCIIGNRHKLQSTSTNMGAIDPYQLLRLRPSTGALFERCQFRGNLR